MESDPPPFPSRLLLFITMIHLFPLFTLPTLDREPSGLHSAGLNRYKKRG